MAVIIFLIMKHTLLILLVLMVLSGCNSTPGRENALPLLTPYSTELVVTDVPEQLMDDPIATPTPVVTSTPVIHIVSLNETVSSIAQQYGISIDAIYAANPGISPNAMIVGDTVVIPQASNTATSVLDDALSGAIQFGPPYCALSGDGLWCSVMVKNSADFDLVNTVIKFIFLDGEGNSLVEKNVPTVLRVLESNSTIPAFLFLVDVPIGYQQVDISIFSAEELSSGSEQVLVVEENRDVQLDSQRALITGELLVQADGGSDQVNMTIAAAALDAAGNTVGVRRKDIVVAKGENVDFSLSVYSSGNEIVDVIFYTEVN